MQFPKNLMMIIGLLLPISIMAQGWDANEYRKIESSVTAPQFPDRQFVITTYGAKTEADAATNQKAINKAITLCNQKGGGSVIVPAGEFKT
jgi:polygalacturonase